MQTSESVQNKTMSNKNVAKAAGGQRDDAAGAATSTAPPTPFSDNAYLRSRDWKPTGDGRWQDPRTGLPPEEKVVMQKKTRSGTRTVIQRVCSPAAWYYSEADAVAIQKRRDEE